MLKIAEITSENSFKLKTLRKLKLKVRLGALEAVGRKGLI